MNEAPRTGTFVLGPPIAAFAWEKSSLRAGFESVPAGTQSPNQPPWVKAFKSRLDECRHVRYNVSGRHERSAS